MGVKVLFYTDLRTANCRTLNVCKELIKALDTCEASVVPHILHNIYYLGGYIIEYSYKFALFSALGLSPRANIYEYRHRDDTEFLEKWKNHSFQKLRKLCADNKMNFSQDIPYFGNYSNKSFKKLVENWDVQIRYDIKLAPQKVELSKETMSEYIKTLEEVINKIHAKYH